MKILIFSQHFFPENFRINEIAKDLNNKFSHKVVVITGKPNYPSGIIFAGYKTKFRDLWDGIDVYRVPMWPRKSGGYLNLILNYLSYIFFSTLSSIFLLSRFKPDVVFCYATSPLLQAIPAIIYSKLFRSKMVLNIQDLWPESLSATNYIKNKTLIILVGYLCKLIYHFSDLILVQSKSFEKKISKEIGSKKIIYWPNSVDSIFLEMVSKNNVSIPCLERNDKFTVMFSGNIGRAQSTDTIINIAKLLEIYTNIQIVMVGDGSQRKDMMDKVESCSLKNINFIGIYPLRDMPYILSKANLLLVTLANREIFSLTVPSKLQAYLASGRPIVGSLNGEGAELIHKSNSGIVVEAENPVMLARAILEMKNKSNEELVRLGSNGRSYFKKHFLHDKLLEKLNTYFKDLIKSNIKIE